ncbi:hypothetical protein BDK51DRAFT_33077 [Blyttiomyces helicus]|uniref:Uncharacterized protein n=1 Tax=Blyttiomyces helicus TaxID=388810 RepID=A0A4P9WHH5_9FUNG|nr:hypothetical protein BDK51DRAFT_33077 [Blyttiomyces helicus]|eukprot:RKO89986.1 hypothetical protein BDK51DRAFT_33077 [Blyttiomyces helicus]
MTAAGPVSEVPEAGSESVLYARAGLRRHIHNTDGTGQSGMIPYILNASTRPRALLTQYRTYFLPLPRIHGREVRSLRSRFQPILVTMLDLHRWIVARIGRVHCMQRERHLTAKLPSLPCGSHPCRMVVLQFVRRLSGYWFDYDATVSALVFRYPLSWPQALSGIINFLLSSNLDLIRIACLIGSPNKQLNLLLIFPLIFIMGLAAVASVWALWHSAWRNMGVRTAFLRASEISLNALVLFSKIAHIPMSKEFTSTFECATDGENYMRVRFCSRRQTLKPTNSRAIASPPEADRSYLLSSPDITCYSSACAHETAMVASALRNNQRAVAIAGCFLYVAGIPVLLLLASWRFAGRRTEDVVSRRMGALFSTYRDGCWYFEGLHRISVVKGSFLSGEHIWDPYSLEFKPRTLDAGYRTIWNLGLLLTPIIFANSPASICLMTFCLIFADCALRKGGNKGLRAGGAALDSTAGPPTPPSPRLRADLVITLIPLAGVASPGTSEDSDEAALVVVLVLGSLGITLICGVHILIYEWQTFFFHHIKPSSVFMRTFRSRLWGIIFPLHLDPSGGRRALKRRYLPDPERRPPAQYEKHAECRMLEVRTSTTSTEVEADEKTSLNPPPRIRRGRDIARTAPDVFDDHGDRTCMKIAVPEESGDGWHEGGGKQWGRMSTTARPTFPLPF